MVGVSAMGIGEDTEIGEIPEIKLPLSVPKFTERERFIIGTIVSECKNCILNEGIDCMSTTRKTYCSFIKVRELYGITDIQTWED